MNNKNFFKGISRFIWVVAFFITSALIVLNILYMSVVLPNEQVLIVRNRYRVLYYAFIVVFLIAILGWVLRKSEKLNEKKVFLFFSIFYSILGIYLVSNIDCFIRDDAYWVKLAAEQISEGNYHSLDSGEYLFRYPHQLGMVTYDRILGIFSKKVQVIFLVNLVEILGINWFCYKLTDLLFNHDHCLNLVSICLSFLCLPQFFFTVFAYGTIPGFFFLMAGMFMAYEYLLNHRVMTLVVSIVLLMLACALKNNYVIGGLAVGIYFFLKFVERREWKFMVIAFVLVFMCTVSARGLKILYSIESGKTVSSGVPSVLYIAMGINPENRVRAPGWYDRTVWDCYTDVNFDNKIASDKGIAIIKTSLKYYKGHMKEAVDYFGKKIISMWCEPMYQSTWSGPNEYFKQYVYTDFLRSIYNNGVIGNLITVFMKGWLLLLLMASVVFLICIRKNPFDFYVVLYLYFIGGFLFHLFWEGKSQYIYPYIYALIPCSSYGIGWRLKSLRLERKRRN